MMELASGLISLVGAICLAFVVLHPSIQEGLILKVGMILMIMSMLATFALTVVEPHYDVPSLIASGFILRLGIVTVCLGVLMKARKSVRQKRKMNGERLTRMHLYNIKAPLHDLVEFLKDDQPEKVK